MSQFNSSSRLSSDRLTTRSRLLKKAAKSVIETLEQRQLLSASLEAAAGPGTTHSSGGTSGGPGLTVALSAPKYTIDGPASSGNTSVTNHIGAFSIVPTYTAAVMADPRFNQAGPNIQTAVNYAISQFEAFISTPVTVNITIDEAAGTGTLGGSNVGLNVYNYTDIAPALQANFPSTSVPATDPVAGRHEWLADPAQARALALPGAPSPASDGTYTFGGGWNYSFDPANRAVAGDFDFIGVTEHEISEIMGRGAGLGGNFGDGVPAYFPHDLYRYMSAGTRGITSSGAGNYFSTDNGTTNGKTYNDHNTFGGDSDDWASGTNDSFNAFSGQGVENDITAVDETLMHAIGYAGVAANADLGVTVTAPATSLAGASFNSVVTLTNNGPDAASSITLVDSPANGAGIGQAIITITPAAGNPDSFSIAVVAQTFVLTDAGPMASGNSDVFTVTYAISSDTTSGTTWTNTATVTSATPDTVPANNTASSTTTILTSADLAIVFEGGPSVGTEGTNDTYLFSITNNGSSDAQAVDLLDTTPADARFISETQTSGPAFTETDPGVGNTGNVDFKIGTLAAGASASFFITVLPEEGANVNAITLSSTTPDPTPGNNTASITTAVADATLSSAGVTLPIFTEGQSTGAVPVGSFTDNYASALGELDGAADFTANITWGDGTTTAGTVTQDASNKNLYHITGTTTFAEEGLYSTSIAIADKDGTSTATITEQALVVDAPLTVTAVPFTSVEGKTPAVPVLVATFTDADPGGNVNDYSASINWGDGATTSGTIVANGSGGFNVLGTHEYLEEGAYTGHVNVQDAAAGAGVNISGTVSDPAVIATGGKTFTGVEGASTGTLAVATFTDPGGAEPNPADPGPIASHYSAVINWGDGSPVDTTGVITFDAASQTFTVSASHSYLEEGTYTPSVVIKHETAPDSAAVTDTVNVSDPAVVASGGFAISGVEGQTTGPVVVATFTDPGGAEPNPADPGPIASHYTATVNWGDGTAADTSAVITLSGGVFTVTDSHTYAEESGSEHPNSQPYQISVSVAHESAPVSNTVTDTATVSDPAVIASGAPDINGAEGASLTATVATFTDPGGNTEAVGDYLATIDWGDGSGPDTTGVITQPGGPGTAYVVTGTHTYAEESTDDHTGTGDHYVISVVISHESAPNSNAAATNAFIADPAVVATPGSDITAVEGQTTGPVVVATFTDPGGAEDVSDYTPNIDWGDGTPIDNSATVSYDASTQTFSVTGMHTYAEESAPEHPNSQPYVVSVTISHDNGNAPDSDPVTLNATIAELPVIGTALPNASSATVGVSTGPVALAKFIDPGDAEDPLADYSATVNFHDGSAAAATTITYDGMTGYFTVTASHTYNTAGTFAAPTVTILHETSTTVVQDKNPVTVKGNPIVPTGKTVSGIEGRLLSNVNVASFTAANTATTANFSATIKWGDGATTNGTIVKDSAGHFHVIGTHAYVEEMPGGYPLTITIQPTTGSSVTVAGKANIVDGALTGNASLAFTVKKGVAFSNKLLGSFTDQDALNTVASDYVGTSNVVNWGDNTSTKLTSSSFVRTGSNPSVGSFWNVLGSHKYTGSGIMHVTILIKDNGGSVTTLKLTITVTP